MTTVIIILNQPVSYWKDRNTRRLINPDIDGLELDSSSIHIRESALAPWYTIAKSDITSMTIIFSKDAS